MYVSRATDFDWGDAAVVAEARPRAGRSGDNRVRASGAPRSRPCSRVRGRLPSSLKERELVGLDRRARSGPVQTVVLRYSFSASAGVLQPSAFRGRLFSV